MPPSIRVLAAVSGLIAASLTGCGVEVTTSSRTVLGASRSGAVTAHGVTETALEVTRLLEVRGYAMIDQRVDTREGERVLRFAKANRMLAADHGEDEVLYASDVGSVFYVWVTPADGGSRVSLLGKPTLGGIEPCTHDDVVLTCRPLSADLRFVQAHLSARNEVDVARGVLSQLALEGYAIGPMPADAPPPSLGRPVATAADECHLRRRDALLQVIAEPSPDEKRRLFDAVPTC